MAQPKDAIQTGDLAVDRLLHDYFRDLDTLANQANDGDITREAFILSALALVDQYSAALYAQGGGDLVKLGSALRKWKRQQATSLRLLADDLYSGKYQERTEEEATQGRPAQTAKEATRKLASRLVAWAVAMYTANNLGVVNRPDDIKPTGEREEPRSVWLRGPTKEGCHTCVGLDGVVMVNSDWQTLEGLGVFPGYPDLDCGGYRCLCGVFATQEAVTHSAQEALARIQ